MSDQVGDDVVDHRAHRFVNQRPAIDGAEALARARVMRAEQFGFGKFVFGQQTGAQTVVDVVIIVRDLIGEIGQLGLQAGLPALQEPFADIAEHTGIALRAVLENPFTGFERQVQARKPGVAILEFVDDAQ